MKTKKGLISLILLSASTCLAATTIDPANKHAYGANTGWINAEGDVVNGIEVGTEFCSGYMYGANIGWIHLGNGAPVNGTAYVNNSATDYGINNDGLGNLTGYAYGANIGWINFEQTYGQPKVDMGTGQFSGYAWGANVGWIDLSTLVTLTFGGNGDTDFDGIPDAWEYGHTNSLTILNGGDADGDGISDLGEYLGDTDPFDAGDYLHITGFQTVGTTNYVTWPVKTTRQYTLQHATVLSNGMSWIETSTPFVPAFGPDVTEEVLGSTDSNRFYRVQAQPPLSP